MSYKLLRNIIFGFFIVSASVVLGAEIPKQGTPVGSVSNISSQQVVSVNINSADYATLQKIKGMSKKKAKAIVSYREKNGPFKSLEDLLKVKCRGIHKKWLDKVSKFLIV